MLRTDLAMPGDGFSLDTIADVLTGTRTTGSCRLDARVNIRYRVADPFAVTLDVADGDGWVRWTLDRDLLVKGMTTAAGLGDVQVCTVGDREVRITLSCPGGEAELVFSRRWSNRQWPRSRTWCRRVRSGTGSTSTPRLPAVLVTRDDPHHCGHVRAREALEGRPRRSPD